MHIRPYVKEKRCSIGVAWAKLKQPLVKVLLLSAIRLMPEFLLDTGIQGLRKANEISDSGNRENQCCYNIWNNILKPDIILNIFFKNKEFTKGIPFIFSLCYAT